MHNPFRTTAARARVQGIRTMQQDDLGQKWLCTRLARAGGAQGEIRSTSPGSSLDGIALYSTANSPKRKVQVDACRHRTWARSRGNVDVQFRIRVLLEEAPGAAPSHGCQAPVLQRIRLEPGQPGQRLLRGRAKSAYPDESGGRCHTSIAARNSTENSLHAQRTAIDS